MTTRQSTYDGRDTNVLKYSGIWFLDGTWSDASGGSGTLASTNDQNGYVSFVRLILPVFWLSKAHMGLPSYTDIPKSVGSIYAVLWPKQHTHV